MSEEKDVPGDENPKDQHLPGEKKPTDDSTTETNQPSKEETMEVHAHSHSGHSKKTWREYFWEFQSVDKKRIKTNRLIVFTKDHCIW